MPKKTEKISTEMLIGLSSLERCAYKYFSSFIVSILTIFTMNTYYLCNEKNDKCYFKKCILKDELSK